MNTLSPVRDTNRDVAAVRRDIPANTPVQLYPSPPATGVHPPENTISVPSKASPYPIERMPANPYTLAVPPVSLEPVQRSATHPPLPPPRQEVRIKDEVDHRASSLPATVQVTPTSTRVEIPPASTSYPIVSTPEESSHPNPSDPIEDIVEEYVPAEAPEQRPETPSADVKMESQAIDLPTTSTTTLSPPPTADTSASTVLSPVASATDTTAMDTEDVEMRAADEEDAMSSDEDEPLRLDAEGLRVVEDCLEELFDEDDDDPNSKVCMLCRNRFQSGAITEEPTIYVKATEQELVDHCVAEHPTAWERLRLPS